MTQPTKLKIWCDYCSGSGNTGSHDQTICKVCKGEGYREQSFEPLEVNIIEKPFTYGKYVIRHSPSFYKQRFETKEDAISWCKQKVLRVVE